MNFFFHSKRYRVTPPPQVFLYGGQDILYRSHANNTRKEKKAISPHSTMYNYRLDRLRCVNTN